MSNNKKVNIKFVIPVIIEEITDKCLSKYDLDWKQLILVDNSKDGFCKKYLDKGAEIRFHPENLGVAGSWNYGIRSDADFLWIISSSLIFNKGFSELIEKTKEANEYGLLTDEAWHCIGFTRKTFDKVGMFDEQFYPGYYEDNDFGYRLKLAGIHNHPDFPSLPKVKIDVTCQGTATTLKSGLVKPRFDLLQEYYKRKWGGLPGNEKFIIPFNQEVT